MAVRLSVDPDEDLDQILARLKNYDSQDVVLNLPNDTRALQDLNSFTALRNTVRTDNINLTIAGGNKTIRALANLLGFAVEKPSSSIPRPDVSVSPAGSGQGTIIHPDYSGVADGFVATTSEQKFSRPESGFPVVTPPPVPAQVPAQVPPQVQAQAQPQQQVPAQMRSLKQTTQPQNFAGGQAQPNAENRQPRPQPGFNLPGNQLQNQPGNPITQPNKLPNNQAAPSSDDRTRSGFFASPAPELGKMDATFQSDPPLTAARPGYAAGDFEPLPGFLDELVAEDTVAGQFRAKQGTPAPRPKGAFFAQKNQRSFPADEQSDLYDIEEVPDPDSDPADAAAAAAVFGVNAQPRPAPQPPRPRGRPVTGSVSGRVAKGGVGAFLVSGDRRTTITLALAVLFAFLLVVVLFLLLVKPGGVMTLVTPKVQTLTVPLRTELVTNTLRLQLLPPGSVAPTQGAIVPAGTSSQPVSGTTAAGGTPGAAPNTAVANLTPATLPVEVINTGEIKKSGQTPATGVRKVPDQSASGPVAFYNRSFAPKSYGAGTVIYTHNGVSYRLVDGLTIPGSTQFNGQAGQATGQVAADKAGTVGNITEVVSFPLNENVGVGLGPLTNGTDKDEKFVQQADLDGLKKQLQDQARAEVNNALKYDQTTQGVFVLKTTEPTCDFPQKVNDNAATVNGSCTTSLQAARYRTADVVAGAAAHFVTDPALQLDTQTPLEFIGPPKLVQDGDNNYMEIQVRGRIIHLLDTNAFKTAIAGQTKIAASTLITTSFPQVDTTQLDLTTITGDSLPAVNLLEIKTVLDYEASAPTVSTTSGTPGVNTSGTPGATVGVVTSGATVGAAAPTPTPKS